MAVTSRTQAPDTIAKRTLNPEGFTRNEKGKDIRHQNITAAKGVPYFVYIDIILFCLSIYYLFCSFSLYLIIYIVHDLRFHFIVHLFLAVADAIRTSLGPKGMDKMVIEYIYELYCIVLTISLRFKTQRMAL